MAAWVIDAGIAVRPEQSGTAGRTVRLTYRNEYPRMALVEKLADELGQPDLSPQVFQNIDVAVGPSVEHAQRRVLGGELFGRAALQDASGEAAQPFGGLGVVAAPAAMEDAYAGALLARVPDVLGDLQVAQHRAIDALLVGLRRYMYPMVRALSGKYKYLYRHTCIYENPADI